MMTTVEFDVEKVVEGLKLVIEGLVGWENGITNVTASDSTEEFEVEEIEVEELTKESLDKMTYSAIKLLAKEKGIQPAPRAELIEALLELEAVEESPAEETPKAENKATETEQKVEEENEEEDPIVKMVMEEVEGMSDEEIADLLTEVGISPKGKRQALIAKVIKGVRDGSIDLNEEEEEEEAPAPEVKETLAEEEATEEKPLEEAEEQTVREKAVEVYEKSLEEFPISQEEMERCIEKLTGSKDDLFKKVGRVKKKKSVEEIAQMYFELNAMFIDDEGTMNEMETPYTVEGEYYCCGEPLKVDGDGNFVCEVCEQEYDVEEEEE